MRNILLTLMILVASIPLWAQDRNNEEEVVKLNTRHSRYDYVEGELIVKFKETSSVQVQRQKGKFRSASVKAVDAVMSELGGFEMEELMPLTGKQVARRPAKSFTGKPVKDVDLGKLYRIKFNANNIKRIEEAVNKFKQLDDVEYAEPNYRVYALSSGENATYTAEPLYEQQWGIGCINLPALWDVEKITGKRPVIAILDTGVDIDHPDLKDNIWTNEMEANGSEGIDDDGNGFADDVHGWDFINQTGNMDDYNGHGTHCAGIAAAVGNNGIGITGANPDALIMPISVMQSTGTGDVATIINGVDYAIANGADVLSMSLGTYAESKTYELAFAKAYQQAIIVAAAGNDGASIYSNIGPMFPAAYTFVLGVQASDGDELAKFSNYDNDGALYSSFSQEELYNYELVAPGVDIISTWPSGEYKSFNGTSMACPLVAGAISYLLQCKEYLSKELLFGDLINSASFNVDIYSAYNISKEDRNPTLAIVTNGLDDTEYGDGDLRADAGEIINFYPIVRNHWGEAKNIVVSLEMGELEDSTLVEFVTSQVKYNGSLSSYAIGKFTTPLQMRIDENCVDGRIIKLRMRATCDSVKEDFVQDFEIKVENGVELTRFINSDMTLYPNVHYIVTHGCYVAPDVTLTIMPGTIIKIKENAIFQVDPTAKLICVGTPEQPITFTKTDLDAWGGEIVMPAYYEFGNLIYNQKFEYTIFKYIYTNVNSSIDCFDCLFEDCILDNPCLNPVRTNIIYNNAESGISFFDSTSACNFIENVISTNFAIAGSNTFSNNSVYSGVECCSACCIGDFALIKHDRPSYLGTASEDIVKNYILDMYHPNSPAGNFMVFDYSNMLKEPVAEAHGIVWKVLVNGYDAQDEYELLPPLGVGKHKFEVYFNRPMKKTVEPVVAMGVRPPYNQNLITEEGSWNEEGTIYTAYLTITGKTATEGINRIYVADAEDNEHFVIPVENKRFNVNVQVAGSMSTGFMADPGLGRVHLSWDTPVSDIDDVLGYNMYRYTMIDETEMNTPVCINKHLIEVDETSFVDKNVVSGETYYYYYTILSTSLTESTPSKVVSATPLTVTYGDANGTTTVDYEDILAEVAFITGEEPQPFVREAADVNADDVIDILDIIATANIANNISVNIPGSNSVKYMIEDGILYVNTPVSLGGVQLILNTPSDVKITKHEDLSGFEVVVSNGEDGCLVLIYSMTGNTISTGKHALLNVGDAEIVDILIGDAAGQRVNAIDGSDNSVGAIELVQMRLPYPSMFTDYLNIPYVIGKSGMCKVSIVITDICGRTVDNYTTTNDYGVYNYTWTSKGVCDGIYFVSLYVDDTLMQTAKVVKK